MIRAQDVPPSDGTDRVELAPDPRLLARVEALLPEIAAASPAIERDKRIPEPLLKKMVDADMFRIFLPRSLGGLESSPLTYMHVAEAVAMRDASTAWNLGQTNVCGLVGAYLAPEIGRKVFGDRRAVLAWGQPEGPVKAQACEGGYRVTGRWFFVSGGRHATWLGAYGAVTEADGSPRLDGNGQPLRRVFLVPADQVTWHDVWDTIGLRGTASDAFSVDDLFVPESYTVFRDENTENREPGWLYCFTTRSIYPCGFASIALGVSRAMLDDFIQLALKKTPRGMPSPMSQSTAIQTDLGRAEGMWRSARTHLRQTMREVCEAVRRDHELTMAQRMELRLAATHAIQQAREVGDMAYEAASATAIFASSPFERRFRDLHTVCQHVQGRNSHLETFGKFLLGQETDLTFV